MLIKGKYVVMMIIPITMMIIIVIETKAILMIAISQV